MGNPLGGRGQDKLMAMCLFPSINWTPVKYALPLPYPVWQMLGNSEDTIVTVKFNDSEVYGLKNTYQPHCVGDYPGQGGGIKSKTVSDEVRPTDGSATVIVNGQKLVRKGDPCTLNKANTFGKYMTLGEALSGIAHLVLGALSFIPGVGSIASVADAALYALEGDMVAAGMSLAGAIPGCKWAMALGKLTKGIKLANLGKMGNMFTKAGTWIKGVAGKVKPCVLGGVVSGAMKAHGLIGAISSVKSYLGSVVSIFGSPVHAYRGAKILMGDDDLDYQGSGYLPFYLQRLYNSQNPDIGWFGQGWKVQGLEQRLELHPQQDTIYLIDNSGRRIPFDYLAPGKRSYQPYEDITLYRLPISDDKKDTLLAGQPIDANAANGTRIGDDEPLHFILYQGDYHPTHNAQQQGIAIHYQTVIERSQTHATLVVSKHTDNYGHSLQLYYTHDNQSDFAHLPHYITDANGHCYKLEFNLIDGQARLSKLSQIHHIDQPAEILSEYSYSTDGELTAVYHKGQLVREFAYTQHLMTWQRYLTGLEGNYLYDQTDNPATARVIDHTLNTGQHYRFDYHTDEQGNHHSTVTEQPGTDLEQQHHYIADSWYNLTDYTDPLGNHTHITVDHLNRITRVTDPKGGYIRLQYHGKQLGMVEQKLGTDPITGKAIFRRYLYQYDKDKLIGMSDPLGNTTKLTYNAQGELISTTDANAHSDHYEYDKDGNLTQHTLANGSSYSYTYDSDGKLISQTDCSGYTTHYQYDTLERITAVVDAMGYATHYHYENTKPHLQLIRQIDYPDGSFIKLEHDLAGRLIRHIDAKGQVTQYQYDIDNRPIKRIDALGHTLSYQYDPLRRLAVLTNENGEDWTFDYDKADNLISETRFDDYQSRYEYDKLGDLIHQIDNPNLPRIEQRHTYLQRDLIGQLIAKHSLDYDSQETGLAHNDNPVIQPFANISQAQSDPIQRKHSTRYQYDVAGQLIRAVSPDATTRIVYDPVGQIISETLHRHHSHADISTESKQANSHHTHKPQQAIISQMLTHEYDEVGNRIATTLPDGKRLNQLYYGSGHLYNQSLTDEQGNIHEIRHSTTDRLHQELTRQQGELLSSFGYDPMGRLITQVAKQYSSTDEHIVVERHYRYDKIGQLTHLTGQTRLTERVKGMVNQVSVSHFGRNHQYQYDKVGRLVGHKLTDFANHAGVAENFAFDPASNRIPLPSAETTENGGQNDLQGIDKKTKRPTKLISQGKQVGYFYDKHGRVKTKTLVPIDKNGNEIPQSTHNLVGYRESLQLFYSPNHELIKSITIKDEGLKVVKTVTHYYYDAFGRRIGKSSSTQKSSKLNQRGELVKFPSNLSSLNTTDRPQRNNTLMLWDGNRQIQEYTDEHIFTTVYEQNSFEPVARVVQLSEVLEKQRINNAVTHVWQYVPSGIVTQDVLDNVEKAKQPLVKIYYYHNNHLGTPQELTDSDGDVVWLSYDYSWGGQFDRHYKPQQVGNYDVSESELQPIKFQGQSLDTETGLHYNRFRYYDSDVGMFISRDPIELLGGFNVFAYAPNPVMWIDPWGLECVYRAIRNSEEEMIEAGLGIVKPKPYARTTINQHVGGVKHKKNPWVSTTRDLETAKNKYGADGATIIKIDLDKIDSSKIFDISTREKAESLLKSPKSRNYAVADRELLIFGDVPPSAIEIVK